MRISSTTPQIHSEDADETLFRLYRDGSVADRWFDCRNICSNVRSTVCWRLPAIIPCLSFLLARARAHPRARKRSRTRTRRMQKRSSDRHWRHATDDQVGAASSEPRMGKISAGEFRPGMVRRRRCERPSARLLPRRARRKSLQGCRHSMQGALKYRFPATLNFAERRGLIRFVRSDHVFYRAGGRSGPVSRSWFDCAVD
jgi:hypothetical protein